MVRRLKGKERPIPPSYLLTSTKKFFIGHSHLSFLPIKLWHGEDILDDAFDSMDYIIPFEKETSGEEVIDKNAGE